MLSNQKNNIRIMDLSIGFIYPEIYAKKHNKFYIIPFGYLPLSLLKKRSKTLPDGQWVILEALCHKDRVEAGWPQIHSDRNGVNEVLWVLHTGAAWADLPDRFLSSSTCYRRVRIVVKDGRLGKVLEALARHLKDNELINLEEYFSDGPFVVARKGGLKLESPDGIKVRCSMSEHHYFRDFASYDSGIQPWSLVAARLHRTGQPLGQLVAERMAAFQCSVREPAGWRTDTPILMRPARCMRTTWTA